MIKTLKEFKGMLWGQEIKIYTDHQNLIQDALSTALNRVYHWRLLLERFDPEIVQIKVIRDTISDSISRRYYKPTTKPADAYKKGMRQLAMCYSAFMQWLADKNDIDEPHVRWKTISKCFNIIMFKSSISV